MDNKVTFGLKNTHYSVITESEDGIKYGTPTPRIRKIISKNI